MRKLLNTLYVTTPERYLALDGENVLVLEEKKVLIRLPLHNLEGIVTFGYTGASPALMCEEGNFPKFYESKRTVFSIRKRGEQGQCYFKKTAV